ncbi:hypothetical protein XH81_30125 [Bradyrhizobium sp. CCBAU 25360]|uniref:hypothetical protein n=1 Tax=Bradyrhizobium sp. CCBAU 25360 TaxID=858425 RepID=UPI002306638B|nr:hypothetical protein [Bradyrhizobium sp. CCBAU 25360]MDA9419098.1 hypothetical protein [Bradyrhizobium sp. CCBAU 25360]
MPFTDVVPVGTSEDNLLEVLERIKDELESDSRLVERCRSHVPAMQVMSRDESTILIKGTFDEGLRKMMLALGRDPSSIEFEVSISLSSGTTLVYTASDARSMASSRAIMEHIERELDGILDRFFSNITYNARKARAKEYIKKYLPKKLGPMIRALDLNGEQGTVKKVVTVISRK